MKKNPDNFELIATNGTVIVGEIDIVDNTAKKDITDGGIHIPNSAYRGEQYNLVYRKILSIGPNVKDETLEVGDVICCNAVVMFDAPFGSRIVNILDQEAILFKIKENLIIT